MTPCHQEEKLFDDSMPPCHEEEKLFDNSMPPCHLEGKLMDESYFSRTKQRPFLLLRCPV
jgi:hypothetical protein